jgi:pectinesterase
VRGTATSRRPHGSDATKGALHLVVRLGCSLVAALCLASNLSLAAEPEHKVRIVLVGDSTVNDKTGWGPGFKRMLTDRAECFNVAANGRSSKSYINEGRWTNALALKGAYYLIQFGHNDEPGKGPDRETDPATTYHSYMARYVDDASAIGAKAILITSLTRRQFTGPNHDKIKPNLDPYVAEVKKLAAEKKVALLDLHAASIEVCERLGRDGCVELSPMKTENGTNTVDSTHLNEKGSLVFGRLVAEELARLVPELSPCIDIKP